ncbi:RabGAP/TBC domain-containing protein [Planoprotostelium fungivorum]|uniref:RabGAP/TBC domain-containing protein n=1 Tax=Planoprotostelium fungivorum TaxID=1890364 RepID=A0A2P6NB11_9EUKA|nr:RabGAP/TBC domain-containing protein [Planoprotostelium fungivorum]
MTAKKLNDSFENVETEDLQDLEGICDIKPSKPCSSLPRPKLIERPIFKKILQGQNKASFTFGALDPKDPMIGLRFDEYGFLLNHHLTKPVVRESLSVVQIREKQRKINEWRQILREWPANMGPSLVSLIEAGLPHEIRAQVWKKLTSASFPASQTHGYFDEMLSIRPRKKVVEQIDLDLPRTFPNHKIFLPELMNVCHGQDYLGQVLRAYSVHNSAVGYCQGMSYGAALLLMHFPQPEEAFRHFSFIMDGKLDRHFCHRMPGLIEDVATFAKLLEEALPKLYRHFQTEGLDCTIFLSQWWLSLFTSVPLWSTTLYAWDMLFLHGPKSLFTTALSVLSCCQDELLLLRGEGQMVPYLLNPPPEKTQPSALCHAAKLFNVDNLLARHRSAVQVRSPIRSPLSSPIKSPIRSPLRAASPRSSTKKVGRSLLDRFVDRITPRKSPRKRSLLEDEATPQIDKKKRMEGNDENVVNCIRLDVADDFKGVNGFKEFSSPARRVISFGEVDSPISPQGTELRDITRTPEIHQ